MEGKRSQQQAGQRLSFVMMAVGIRDTDLRSIPLKSTAYRHGHWRLWTYLIALLFAVPTGFKDGSMVHQIRLL